MSQNLAKSMSYGTIGVMKVLGVKGIEAQGDLWAVRYTYLRADGGKKGGMFLYDTREKAQNKHQELLDVLKHHDGVYLGKKAKKKLRTSSSKQGNRMRIGDAVQIINQHYPRYGEVGKVISREQTPIGLLWRVRFADQDGLYHQEALRILTAR
jgi:hypothetical protein